MEQAALDPKYFPIRITMFGDMKIEAGKLSVSRKLRGSKKMSSLLAYLIVNSDRAIPYEELLSAIWPEAERDDPVNALKTLVYRIRAQFKEDGLPFYRTCILVYRGTYRWNPSFPFVLDVFEFETACKTAFDPCCPQQRQTELLTRAVGLYKGEFLPKCTMDKWVAPRAAEYYALYLRGVNLLLRLLREKQMDEEIVQVCRKTLAMEPLDEGLNYNLLVSLIDLSRTEEARSHYNYISRVSFHKLGVPPSDRIRDLYQRMMDSDKHTESDLSFIQKELREPEGSSGAYVCEYSLFKEIYRLQLRMAARAGITIYVQLVTITGTGSRPLGLKALNFAMDQLESIMRDSLRKTDVVSRFSSSQYVLMLPGSSAERCLSGIRRVIAIFKRKHPHSQAIIRHTIQPLEEEPC